MGQLRRLKTPRHCATKSFPRYGARLSSSLLPSKNDPRVRITPKRDKVLKQASDFFMPAPILGPLPNIHPKKCNILGDTASRERSFTRVVSRRLQCGTIVKKACPRPRRAPARSLRGNMFVIVKYLYLMIKK